MKALQGSTALLSTEQAAERLGLSSSTLAKWRVAGTGPAFRKLGSAVRYDPADIQDWISANARSSTSHSAV